MLASITMVSSCCLACRGDTHLAMCGARDDGGRSAPLSPPSSVLTLLRVVRQGGHVHNVAGHVAVQLLDANLVVLPVAPGAIAHPGHGARPPIGRPVT